jgi:ribosomal protein S18 acetylase RimI-like enzyme
MGNDQDAPLQLRRLALTDLHELWEIFSEIAGAGETYVQDAATTFEEFEPYWCGRGGEQWVAQSGNRIAGGYTLRSNYPGRGARVATASYIVARSARGRGLGRQLGEHSLARARALQFGAMQFNFVVSTNTAAVRLWQSLGFRTLARLPGAFEHARLGAVDALVMFRELASAAPADLDLGGRLHGAVMRSFAVRGRAPTVAELAAELTLEADRVEAGLRRLHVEHGLVLHPDSTDIWVAHPFSASPTATWVEAADERGWWAPCLWCAMGIAVLVAPDAVVHARLGGQSKAVRIELRGGQLVSEDLLVHFALPVREAWNNVVHYCATVLPFAGIEDVARWSSLHGIPRGDAVPLAQVLELARQWYGGYLRDSWRKWTLDEARALFRRVGLDGDTWSVPLGERGF